MATVQAPKNKTSEIEICARLIRADQSDLSRELARHILKLGFEEKDQNRMRELARAEPGGAPDLRGTRGARELRQGWAPPRVVTLQGEEVAEGGEVVLRDPWTQPWQEKCESERETPANIAGCPRPSTRRSLSRSTISSLASTAVRQSLRTLLSPAFTTISSRNAGQELGMVSPELNSELGVTGTGTSSPRALHPESSQIGQPFPARDHQPFSARDHQTMPEEPARDATIDSKLQTSFDIGYRLRWRNPLGGREPASSQRSWPALLHGGRVARRERCASASFQPRNRWQNLEESWQITGISRFFALAAFLA